MSQVVESDYLVVGAGAAGMAFTDSLLTHSDATVTIVDRRHAPGGHWVEAYPFVRLHQPSAFYGVESIPLGQDARDDIGSNAGFYELAGGDEIRAYYERVMNRHFLPSGRVRYLPNSEYLGDGRIASTLGNEEWEAHPRRRVVDTTYLEGSFPGSTPPPFEIEEGVRWAPAGALTQIRDRPERFVIIGAGKTALDVGVFLLEQGVAPSAIRWIKPREAWWANRRFQQPLELLPEAMRGVGIQVEAMATASSLDEIFTRLEDGGVFIRIDPTVEADMFRGAIVSEGEVALLRQIKDVIRLGHVQRIERNQIFLDGGSIPTDERTLHIHCASGGIAYRPVRPIFTPEVITVQPFVFRFACFQFAMLGVVEALLGDDDEAKNALCAPIPYWSKNSDVLSGFIAGVMHDMTLRQHPQIQAWARGSRLNHLAGARAYADDPVVREAREKIKAHGPAAFATATRLLNGAS